MSVAVRKSPWKEAEISVAKALGFEELEFLPGVKGTKGTMEPGCATYGSSGRRRSGTGSGRRHRYLDFCVGHEKPLKKWI